MLHPPQPGGSAGYVLGGPVVVAAGVRDGLILRLQVVLVDVASRSQAYLSRTNSRPRRGLSRPAGAS